MQLYYIQSLYVPTLQKFWSDLKKVINHIMKDEKVVLSGDGGITLLVTLINNYWTSFTKYCDLLVESKKLKMTLRN